MPPRPKQSEPAIEFEERLSAVRTFDTALEDINERRGAEYAPPALNFARIAAGAAVIDACPDARVKVALNAIWTKVCRLVESPAHLDSVIDIAGYARTIAMVLDAEGGEE